MTIAVTPSQQRNYLLLRAAQTGAFAFYLAMVIVSMTSTTSAAIKPLVSAVLIFVISCRIYYIFLIARRAEDPDRRDSSLFDKAKASTALCRRDARWQIARIVVILLFVFATTSIPVFQRHVVIAALAAALFAAASSLGDQVFTVPVRSTPSR